MAEVAEIRCRGKERVMHSALVGRGLSEKARGVDRPHPIGWGFRRFRGLGNYGDSPARKYWANSRKGRYVWMRQ